MINWDYYVEKYRCSSRDAAFDIFLDSLVTYYTVDYWVDWNKAQTNTRGIQYELDLLSYVCGKPDAKRAAREILHTNPEIIRILPILMATRDTVKIVTDVSSGTVAQFEFNELKRRTKKKSSANTMSLFAAEETIQWNPDVVEKYSEFLEMSGILTLLSDVSNLHDYVRGVEVGLDSNARKNRSGKAAINAFVPVVAQLLLSYPNLDFRCEVTTKSLIKNGLEIPDEFLKDRWDVVIFDRLCQQRLLLIEVNHYGGQGSKPKSIQRDYNGRYKSLQKAGIEFLWITDGKGWQNLRAPLRAAFDSVNISTIKLAREGYLEHCIKKYLV